MSTHALEFQKHEGKKIPYNSSKMPMVAKTEDHAIEASVQILKKIDGQLHMGTNKAHRKFMEKL